ncbi:hypothetical protein GOODEAATRI_008429 [Goodea atripinnis]|uniref:Uncharacterized protein n=1 Tax=Goodea atripinnis TaxID=208336 RepID=A0ABV0MZP5_9TELE
MAPTSGTIRSEEDFWFPGVPSSTGLSPIPFGRWDLVSVRAGRTSRETCQVREPRPEAPVCLIGPRLNSVASAEQAVS